MCDTAAQVRAFGKEAAACDRYRDAVLKMQGWGLKSAALGGFFGGFNATFTTGAAPFRRLHLAAAHCLCRLGRSLATCKTGWLHGVPVILINIHTTGIAQSILHWL